MRIQFFIFIFLFTALSVSCQSSAGVSIPSKQTFILGEFSDYGYKAKLENKGDQVVTVQLRSKEDASVITTIQLSPKQKESLSVAADQLVAMENASSTEAQVNVKMSKTVKGMSYEGGGLEEETAAAPTETKPTNAKSAPSEYTVDANATPAQNRATATIGKGEAFILGEGTSAKYSVDLKTMGGSIKVSIRNRDTKEQTQGFGLGNGGETVYIRPYEVIYLLNSGSGPAIVSAAFSEPVSGARKVEL
ncbi:MAG: hypothetical protein AB8F78_13495 [Saprospiraceae bacterium]